MYFKRTYEFNIRIVEGQERKKVVLTSTCVKCKDVYVFKSDPAFVLMLREDQLYWEDIHADLDCNFGGPSREPRTHIHD